jgi:hypothetical protein
MDPLTAPRRRLDEIDGFRVQEIFREIIAMSLKAQEEALLRRRCPHLRVLGTYPARTTADGAVDRVRSGTNHATKGL